jgi:hypothetical protein
MAWKSSMARTWTAQLVAAAALSEPCCAGVFLGSLPLRHGPAAGQVAVDEVVRAGLVGHQVGACKAPGLGAALDHFGQYLGRVAEQSDRDRFLAPAVCC